MSKLLNKTALAMLAVYLIWGTTLGSMRIGVSSIPAVLLVCWRFLLAGGLLLLFTLVIRKEAFPTKIELAKQSFIGFFLFFIGNAMSTWAIQYMPTGLAGIMVATTPFWMVMLAGIFPPKERVKPLVMVGILIGFLGMIILLSPQWMHPQQFTARSLVAVVVMLLTAFFWSIGSIYARKQTLQSSMLMSVGLQNLVAGLLLIPVCLMKHAYATHISLPSLAALLYLVFFGTIVATPCYFYSLKNLPVSVTSTFAYVTPILTVVFGVLFLGETLTPAIIIGSLVILSGVILVQVLNQKPAPSKTEPIRIYAQEASPRNEAKLETLTG